MSEKPSAASRTPAAKTKTVPQADSMTNPTKPAAAPTAAAKTAAPSPEPPADEPPPEAAAARSFSRNVVWALAAGGSSMMVHLALLLALGLMMVSTPIKQAPKIIESSVAKDEPQEDIVQKLQKEITPSQTLQVANNAAASASSVAGVAGAISASVAAPKLNTAVVDRPTAMRVDVGTVNVFTQSGSAMVAAAPEGTLGEALMATGNIGDAMDRITQEILNKLAKGKVLVVWAMDQSESMQDDRDEIMARIGRVYQELGLAQSTGSDGNALLTGVISYGATTVLHTPQPTAKVEEIEAAFKAVPVDPTGAEMQCAAVNFAVNNFQKLVSSGGRQMMLIMVTDESGDPASNNTQLENTIALAKQNRVPIYVLGREAVFGYPYAHMHWIDPETKIDFWLRIDRGPETPYPEQLQVDGIHRRYDAHPSGFGPYEQSRMARQTGGIFFMLPSPEANLWRRQEIDYDAEIMRPYLPDLTARADYAAERDKYPMRATVWKVITDLNPYDKRLENVVQVRYWDWPIERDKFAVEAEKEIKKAQTLIKYFGEAQKALEGVAVQRNRDPSLRWRANFDMTYAQLMAYQVRLYEYIAYIKAFAVQPKPIKNELGPARPTNRWDGRYIKRTLVEDPKIVEMREKSLELYRQVIKDHPGTPWAARAEFEIGRGFGMDLIEDYEDPRRANVKVPVL